MKPTDCGNHYTSRQTNITHSTTQIKEEEETILAKVNSKVIIKKKEKQTIYNNHK